MQRSRSTGAPARSVANLTQACEELGRRNRSWPQGAGSARGQARGRAARVEKREVDSILTMATVRRGITICRQGCLPARLAWLALLTVALWGQLPADAFGQAAPAAEVPVIGSAHLPRDLSPWSMFMS